VSLGRRSRRARIFRASSNGHAEECAATSTKLGVLVWACDIGPDYRRQRTEDRGNGVLNAISRVIRRLSSVVRPPLLKRADRKIPQPQIGEPALLPQPEQRPVERQAQGVVPALDRNADALAE